MPLEIMCKRVNLQQLASVAQCGMQSVCHVPKMRYEALHASNSCTFRDFTPTITGLSGLFVLDECQQLQAGTPNVQPLCRHNKHAQTRFKVPEVGA
jgi:hypothetical protein